MDFLFLFLLNAAALAVIYIVLRKRIDKRYSSSAFLEEIDKEVSKIITEMNQTTERNIELIENKLESLSSLGKKTETLILRASKEYNELHDRHEQYRRLGLHTRIRPSAPDVTQKYGTEEQNPGGTPIESADVEPSDNVPVSEPAHPPGSSVQTMKQPYSSAQAAHTRGDSGNDEQSETKREPRDSRDSKRQRVAELYMNGASISEIVESTGLALGEVELMVALIRR